MRKAYLFLLFQLLFLFRANFLWTQVVDDFSDGDFTDNPTWTGDGERFRVNGDGRLQLNDGEAGNATLATAQRRIDDTEWRFWINLSFAPSANNYAEVYLVADNSDFRQPLNGYLLRFGEPGSADAIALYRQDGVERRLICRGADGMIAAAFAARIKVTYANDQWCVYADMNGGEAFRKVASGNDVYHCESGFQGIYCQYTKSNATRFCFDDFYTGTIVVDNTPPEIERVTVLSETELKVLFNEPVTEVSAGYTYNYIVTPGSLIPQDAQLEADGQTALLYFTNPFAMRTEYRLAASDISDMAGNVSQQIEKVFSWNKPEFCDILITEIMARPTPEAGLPAAAYVELYNNSGYPAQMNGWSLRIGNSEKVFGDLLLEADNYLIVCHNNHKEALAVYGRCYGFNSFSLTYGGSPLTLLSAKKEQIAHVSYNDTWYKDALKQAGGWSLERIDRNSYCDHGDNWGASVAPKGGTPGADNSIDGENEETVVPELLHARYLDSHSIEVVFSKPMNPATIMTPSIWEADYNLGAPVSVVPAVSDFSAVRLSFADSIEENTLYTLWLNADGVLDCAGIPFYRNTELHFAVPNEPERLDIVINEVMFNPANVQYVELYNRTERAFDTKSLRFIFENDKGDQKVCAVPSFLLLPDSYVVLTKQADNLMALYHTEKTTVVQAVGFPTLGTSGGTVRIAKAADSTQIVDAMRYNAKMHAPVMASDQGVSLERISPERPSGDATNWHSASETSGFGTPGYRNSQFNDGVAGHEISLEPEVFTPDNDGIDDYLNIRYSFQESGYIANIDIYDAAGRRVRRLVSNATIAAEGTLVWDGKDDSGHLASPGIYVTLIDIVTLRKEKKRYKKTTTLGVRF